jgi:hypothetical protein
LKELRYFSDLRSRISPKAMTEDPDTVADVRAWVNTLRASLPQSVDVAALGVKSKAPFQLLCTREALIWRTEELARTAPILSKPYEQDAGDDTQVGVPAFLFPSRE